MNFNASFIQFICLLILGSLSITKSSLDKGETNEKTGQPSQLLEETYPSTDTEMKPAAEKVEADACCRVCKRRILHQKSEPNEEVKDEKYNIRFEETMLKDETTMDTFKQAILDNSNLFKGKIVLEVGSGLGILSMFAAKAGAARVIAIEESIMANLSEKVIRDNGLSNVITVIRGKVKDMDLPGGIEQVDVIISEWMGFCLLSKSLLGDLISARDKWLRPGGVLLPDRASIFITAVESDDFTAHDLEELAWWDDVYGFKMSVIAEQQRSNLDIPLITFVDDDSVVTSHDLLKSYDLYTVTVDDVGFSAPFELTAKRKDHVDALVVYFSVEFLNCQPQRVLETGPESHFTHYGHPKFYLKSSLQTLPKQKITGKFTIKANRTLENFDVKIGLSFASPYESFSETNLYSI